MKVNEIDYDIVSKLKDIMFLFSTKEKSLLIIVDERGSISIEKRYLFSLSRFLTRIAQKGFYKRKK